MALNLKKIIAWRPSSTVKFTAPTSDSSGLAGGFIYPLTMGISPNTANLTHPDTQQFRSTGIGTLSWDTTDHGVATIDASGLLTTVAAGTCQVTVTDDESQSATSGDVVVS